MLTLLLHGSSFTHYTLCILSHIVYISSICLLCRRESYHIGVPTQYDMLCMYMWSQNKVCSIIIVRLVLCTIQIALGSSFTDVPYDVMMT